MNLNSNKQERGRTIPFKALAAAGALATIAALSGCAPAEEDQIFAGVTAQVEGHDSQSVCSWYVKQVCAGYITKYSLQVEQNPDDVAAARQGEKTSSFNPDIGTIYENSAYGSVRVDKTTWLETADGDTIVFTGPPTEAIQD